MYFCGVIKVTANLKFEIMNVLVFGGKLKDPSKVNELEVRYKNLKGTIMCSDKKTKPNGIWKRAKSINSDGVWFYKFPYEHSGLEIWKKIGLSTGVVLAKGYVEDVVEPKRFLNPDGKEEMLTYGIKKTSDGFYEFYLNETHHPVAYKEKLKELMEGGKTEDEARKIIAKTPICLELYYERGKGLFMVECDAIENGVDIFSPYTTKKYHIQ